VKRTGRGPYFGIVAQEDYDRWLDPEFLDLHELERMLEAFPSDAMVVSS